MSSVVSDTWARALLSASGTNAADVLGELDQLAEMINANPQTWSDLLNPSVSAGTKSIVVGKLLKDATPTTRNFVRLLADKGRLGELDEVHARFRQLVRDRDRHLDVQVTTAVELPDALRAKLEERLSSTTGRSVKLHTTVDPEVIGGLIIQHGDTRIDTSLQGRLEALRLRLLGRDSQS